jgi:hypothetical protein
VHERGYWLIDREKGQAMYRATVDRLAAALGVTPVESVELHRGDPGTSKVGVSIAGDLVPWTSQPVDLPPDKAPDEYRMTVFLLPDAPATALDSASKGVD